MPSKIDWKNDPEYIELMNFLIERTKDAKSPPNIKQLAREFKEKSGSSLEFLGLVSRINRLRSIIDQIDTIDTETKVKMMFALSVSIDEDLLKGLRKDADVEVDGKNRITKYRANDGSLELEGDHSHSAKIKEALKQRKSGIQEDYSDLSQDSMPKTPGSVKRSAAEVPNTSKRTKVKSEDSAPDKSVRIPPRKQAAPNPETQLLRQPKLEEEPGAEEASIFRSGGAPRTSEANHSYTPQIKFLEAMQSLVLFLGIPPSEIHQKIQRKIQNIDGFTTIQNNEVTLTLELLVARIVNHSVPNLMENGKSVSLKEFLCYLKAAILNSKLEGLENLLEKIEEHIKEPESKDKNIPVEKVTRALQDTLNNQKVPPKIDWENDPEYTRLMKFLIVKTKNAKSPLSINALAKEFKEESGSSLNFLGLISRIIRFRPKIRQIDTIDKKTKVKMMFALSASIDDDLLNELQKDADVEIDGNNRITKYRAKDGSVELTGDHSRFTKLKETLKQKKSGSQEDSGDGSQDSSPKIPGSVKRSAVHVPNSSKRTNVKSEDSAPDDSARIPSRGPPNAETQLLRQPKLEGDPGAEEAPISRSGGAPRASGAPEAAIVYIPLGAPVGPNSEPNHAPGAPIHSKSEATDAYTPQIKFLESIQFLILNLDTPSLSPLQAKIDEKLRESSPNEKIANDEMIMAIETLVTKIVNRSVLNLAENVESISLKEFLCYLKAAILHSKLKGLEGSMEKIKERIRESASKDKNIPIEKVISVLQHTLDGI